MSENLNNKNLVQILKKYQLTEKSYKSNNIKDMSDTIRNLVLGERDKNKKIKNMLKQIYNECLTREKQFLEQIRKTFDIKDNLPISCAIDGEIRKYAENFNVFVNSTLSKNSERNSENVSNEQSLIDILMDENFALELSGGMTKIFSHKIAKQNNKDIKVFFEDLLNMFFNQDESNPKNNSKTILKRKKDFSIDFEKFLESYRINIEINKNKVDENFSKRVMDILDEQITNPKNTSEKGISSKVETQLKHAFAEALRATVPQKQWGNLKDYGIELHPNFLTEKDKFNLRVNIIIKDTNNIEDIYDILYQYILDKLNEQSENAAQGWKDNKIKIEQAIIKNMFGKQREKKDIQKIISSYGYAQVRGLLGEIAGAIKFGSQEKITTSITGSDTSKSGQLNYDVVATINKQHFGIQVKNYMGDRLSSFYETSFSISQNNIMKKYFGDAAEDYIFIIANQQFFNFRSKTLNKSYYNYIDNFLRITAGDLKTKILNRADIFLIGNKIVPSSYLIAKVYEKFNEDNALFETNGIPVTKNATEHFKDIKKNNIVKNVNIRFKGISFSLDF